MAGRNAWRWLPGAWARPGVRAARVVLATAIALVGTVGGPIHGVAAQTAPGFTLSHYVQNALSNATFSTSGCTQGRSTSGYVLVILDFGQPWVSGASYGARYWYYGGVQFLSTASIRCMCFTPLATPATAPILSRTGSLSERAHKS